PVGFHYVAQVGKRLLIISLAVGHAARPGRTRTSTATALGIPSALATPGALGIPGGGNRVHPRPAQKLVQPSDRPIPRVGLFNQTNVLWSLGSRPPRWLLPRLRYAGSRRFRPARSRFGVVCRA